MITYSIPTLKIDIGTHPTANTVTPPRPGELDKYNFFVNVSDDEPYQMNKPDTEVHWFPVNEFGYWTYQPFYWITRLMDRAVEEKKDVYLHCHAGAHRSPMMGYLYLRSLGHNPDEAFKLLEEGWKVGADVTKNWLEETFLNDVEYGRIPEDVVQFMKDVRNNPKDSLMTVMHKRKVMDLPQKTVEKSGIKKPVGQIQIVMQEKGLFNK